MTFDATLRLPDGIKGFDVVIPVPLHKQRLKERGFNQSLLLAREVARVFGLEVDYRSLKRIRPTRPQVDLKPDERKKNVKGAFDVKSPERVRGRRVLLVDDVFTTGATVSECARVLKKAGAEVYVLTLARVERF
jgi:ComF family protein